MGKSDYEKCSTTAGATLLYGGFDGVGKGTYRYLVTAKSGTVLYFYCTADGFHCLAGMKIAITVV